MSEKRPAHLKYIHRTTTNNGANSCWIVKLVVDDKIHSRLFSDGKFGGSESALTYAMAYRDRMMRELKVPTVRKKPVRNSADHYAIYRVPGQGSWRVGIGRGENRLLQTFPDSKYGSEEASLAAAQEYRNELLQKAPLLSKQSFMRKVRRNNRSGISGVGVYGEGEKRFWLARIDYKGYGDKKTKSRKYRVSKYGEEEAKAKAIAQREAWVNEVQGLFVRTQGSRDAHAKLGLS